MKFIEDLLNPWIVLGSLIVGLLLIGAALWYLSYSAPDAPIVGPPTAELTIIPAPTRTPAIVATPPVSPTPTLALPPAPLPGVMVPGALVQISGTGGDGLNLRDTPGLNSGIQYLGFESEVFTIVEGPVEADGLVWWYIVGFSDESRSGWAASNFLELVQEP